MTQQQPQNVVRKVVVRKKSGAERIGDGAVQTFIVAPLLIIAGSAIASAAFFAGWGSDEALPWIVIGGLLYLAGIVVSFYGIWVMIEGWRAFGGALERTARASASDGIVKR